jgi:hypothetical protein
MIFRAAFICDKCHHEYTIDLGPQQMAELKTPKKIGEFIGALAPMFAKSCKEHEADCLGPQGPDRSTT